MKSFWLKAYLAEYDISNITIVIKEYALRTQLFSKKYRMATLSYLIATICHKSSKEHKVVILAPYKEKAILPAGTFEDVLFSKRRDGLYWHTVIRDDGVTYCKKQHSVLESLIPA